MILPADVCETRNTLVVGRPPSNDVIVLLEKQTG